MWTKEGFEKSLEGLHPQTQQKIRERLVLTEKKGQPPAFELRARGILVRENGELVK